MQSDDAARLHPLHVPLVEDDPGDVLLAREAFGSPRFPASCTSPPMANRPLASCAGPALMQPRPGQDWSFWI